MAELPIAAIVCLAVGGYTALILIIICIRQILLSRGVCTPGCSCNPCGNEEEPCCQCCTSISEACNCCNPSLNGCLNSVCPNKKNLSCVDILLCQCFGNCFTNDEQNYICGPCTCSCSECDIFNCPECSTLSCCCFEIKLKQTSTHSSPVRPFSTSNSQTSALSSQNAQMVTHQPQYQLQEVKQEAPPILETSQHKQSRKQDLHVSWKNREEKDESSQIITAQVHQAREAKIIDASLEQPHAPEASRQSRPAPSSRKPPKRPSSRPTPSSEQQHPPELSLQSHPAPSSRKPPKPPSSRSRPTPSSQQPHPSELSQESRQTPSTQSPPKPTSSKSRPIQSSRRPLPSPPQTK